MNKGIHELKKRSALTALLAVSVCLAVTFTACSSDEKAVDPLAIEVGTVLSEVSPESGHDAYDAYFGSFEIPDEIFEEMKGKSFKEDGRIRREELRYLRLLYVNYDGDTCMGEMVVNAACADDVVSIFRELYGASYQIKKMVRVDNYYDLVETDDDRDTESDDQSIYDDNTSAFNYRAASNNPDALSNHALGFAIDLNPVENPYVFADGTSGGPDAEKYLDRSKATVENHMLADGDICVETFKKYGFTWGGDWEGDKDYQHFECAEKTEVQ